MISSNYSATTSYRHTIEDLVAGDDSVLCGQTVATLNETNSAMDTIISLFKAKAYSQIFTSLYNHQKAIETAHLQSINRVLKEFRQELKNHSISPEEQKDLEAITAILKNVQTGPSLNNKDVQEFHRLCQNIKNISEGVNNTVQKTLKAKLKHNYNRPFSIYPKQNTATKFVNHLDSEDTSIKNKFWVESSLETKKQWQTEKQREKRFEQKRLKEKEIEKKKIKSKILYQQEQEANIKKENVES